MPFLPRHAGPGPLWLGDPQPPPRPANPNARYFVASGAGNWSSTTSWSMSSGGSPGATVPTATEDVVLDNNSVGALTVDVAASCRTFTWNGRVVKTGVLTIGAASSLTVSGLLTLAGNSSSNPILVRTATFGTSATITAASVALSNVDFMDITGAGAASPFTGTSLGDAQGNSGITFTTPVTRYGVVAGNWSSTATWSTSTGGGGGASIPLPQDAVILDANSAAGTYTADMPRLCAGLTCTGFTRTLTVSVTTAVFGSVALASGMTFTGAPNFILNSRTAFTTTTAGKTWPGLVGTTNASGGAWTLSDDLLAGTGGVFVGNVFNANGFNVTSAGTFQTAATATLNMGGGTFTLTGTGTVWAAFNAATISASTSTIVISDTSSTAKTFTGATHAYNNLTITGGGTGSITISGSNTFNFLRIGAPKTVLFTAGTTQTLADLFATGSAGNVITLGSTVNTSTWTLSAATGAVICDWLSLQDSHAVGGASWYAGANSTTTGVNNTGWVFTGLPSSTDTSASTDVATCAGAFARSSADTTVSTDAATRVDQVARTASDASVTSDAATRAPLTFARTASDTSASTDAAPRGLTVARTAADTTVTSDAAVQVRSAARAGTDTSLSTDAATRAPLTLARTGGDTTVTSDAATRAVAFARAASDTTLSTDAATRAAPLARSGSDTSVSTDAAIRTQPKTRTTADTTASTDAAVRSSTSWARSGADTTLTVDAALKGGSGIRTAADTSVSTDADTRVVVFQRTTSDTSASSDAATRAAPHARTSADTSTSTDTATRSAAAFARSSTDTTNSTDSAARAPLARARSASDTSVSTDAALKGAGTSRSASDTTTSADTATRGLTLTRTASDVTASSDAAARALRITQTAADASLTTDSATRRVFATRTGLDVSASTDTATRALRLTHTSSDTNPSTDTATRALVMAQTASDTTASTDAAKGASAVIATWHGPFSPASLVLIGKGLIRVSYGTQVTVTSAQATQLAASDPAWWAFG